MTRAENMARVRDGQYCRRCGRSILNYPSSLHHRQPKGLGGGTPKRYDRASNLVRVCGTGSSPDCHGWIHQHPADAYVSGWLTHRWDNPAAVPLVDLEGSRFLLTDDGREVAL